MWRKLSNWGPVFLSINLALGLVFAFWGYGLYAHRIDQPAAAAEKEKEITRLKAAVTAAEQHWRTALQPLVRAETLRPELQQWYADHLKNLREGPKPPQALVAVKGQLQLEANGRPKLGPVLDDKNQPIAGLSSLKEENAAHTKLTATIANVMNGIKTALEQEQQLNAQIGDGTKGLRADLAKQYLNEKNSLEEQEDLKPLLYNHQAEAQLLAKRKKALEGRLQELQSVRVAKQP